MGWRYVCSASATVHVDDLEARRREVLVALIPFDFVQLREDWREAANRIVGSLWVGDMPLNAVDRQNATKRSAPADAHDIAKRFLAGRLAQHTPVDVFVTRCKRLNDFQRAFPCTALFITRDQHRETAGGVRVRCEKLLDSNHHGRQAAFHVG